MKKVLFVITKSNAGGAQRYVYDLAHNLPKTDFTAKVAFGGTGEKNASSGTLEKRLNEANIETIQIRNFMRDVSLVSDIRAFFELISLFRKEKPDIVHLNSAKAVAIGALAARVARVPRIISTVHGWTSNELRPRWQRVLIRCIERVGIILAHETIVVCNHDERASTRVIHNGIEPPCFLALEEARRLLGLPHDAFVVGTIGELNRNKNTCALIEAFAALPAQSQNILAIIGDGEQRTELAVQIHKHSEHDIRLIGYKENASQYLKTFDVFVLPSLKEGLPYVLLEAGMAELPVIATAVGGSSEIIHDKHTGLLVASHDTTSLTHALLLYMQNKTLRREHGVTLKDTVEKKYTLERMVSETSVLY